MGEEDARYLSIDGRRWRRSDPAIPEALRKELVNELMSARRAVQQAKKALDPQAERAARDRVHDAKIALGERGAQWWTPVQADAQRSRARAAIRALLRGRGPNKTICPSDVARVIGGGSFRPLMPLVREVALALHAQGEVALLQRGHVLDPALAIRGPIRLALSTPEHAARRS